MGLYAASVRSGKAFSAMLSVNTAMQVRKYRQRQASIVPECFKASLSKTQALTKFSNFQEFKQKATRVTGEISQGKTDVFSLSRIVR